MLLEQLDIESAMLAKEHGQELADLGADVLYRAALDEAICKLARSGVSFTADDARDIAGDPPPGFSPNIAGARFGAASKARIIRPIGFARSSRLVGHGNRLLLWRGC